MIANGMAINTNYSPKIIPNKKIDIDRKPAENIPEKTKRELSQVGKVIRENVEINREALERGIEEINKNIKIFNTKLSFTIDKPTGRTLIKITDIETNEVIREIPPSEFLKLVLDFYLFLIFLFCF